MGAGAFPVQSLGPFGCRSPQDELTVAGLSHRKFVLASLYETVPAVEALGAMIFREHADPQRARAVLLQPVEDGLQQPAARAPALAALQQVDPFQFAADRRHLGVRQAAGASGRVA